jgi:hypothetical protein
VRCNPGSRPPAAPGSSDVKEVVRFSFAPTAYSLTPRFGEQVGKPHNPLSAALCEEHQGLRARARSQVRSRPTRGVFRRYHIGWRRMDSLHGRLAHERAQIQEMKQRLERCARRHVATLMPFATKLDQSGRVRKCDDVFSTPDLDRPSLSQTFQQFFCEASWPLDPKAVLAIKLFTERRTRFPSMSSAW